MGYYIEQDSQRQNLKWGIIRSKTVRMFPLKLSQKRFRSVLRESR